MNEDQIEKLKAYIEAKIEYTIAQHENERHDDYEFTPVEEEKQVKTTWLAFAESIKAV